MSRYKKAAAAFLFMVLLWGGLFIVLFILKTISANKILSFKGEVDIFLRQNDEGNGLYTFLAEDKKYYKNIVLLGSSSAKNMPRELENQIKQSLQNFVFTKKSTEYYLNVWDYSMQNLIKSYGLAPKVTQPTTNVIYQPFGKILETSVEVNLQWPIKDKIEIVSGYGLRLLGNRLDKHGGIDIKVSSGTPVYAAYQGEVVRTGSGCKEVSDSCLSISCRVSNNDCCCNNGLGNFVMIKHVLSDGTTFYTHYDHLKEVHVKVGDKVNQNTIIGKSGNTGYSSGPHLHFELNLNQVKNDDTSINPCSYLPNPPSNCEQESLKNVKRGGLQRFVATADIPLPNGERGKIELIL
ncbi:MAG: M23 family metallopeptidase [Candidatus Aenigmatarchaeota archaeon]